MIEIRNLVKKFDQRYALRGINFKLEKGEIYSLLGPNGAGKTTTIKILAGLLQWDEGEIQVNGHVYDRNDSKVKQVIAYVPDEPFVYSKLTGEEHLHFYADLYKVPTSERQEKIDHYFKYFEFEAYRHEMVEGYSAGTRQKLLISQALLVEPAVLLLDEPLVSIDPVVGRKFKIMLKEVAKKGTSCIFATHILSLAQEISNRIGIIVNGEIITEGDIDQLLEISKGENLEDFYFHTVMAYEKSL